MHLNNLCAEQCWRRRASHWALCARADRSRAPGRRLSFGTRAVARTGPRGRRTLARSPSRRQQFCCDSRAGDRVRDLDRAGPNT